MTTLLRKPIDARALVFLAGLALFAAMAALGWWKLSYGFNFIDEGYHMTESWRLAAGDRLIRDELFRSNMLYTQINRWVFEIFPDTTLLGFRRLQYGLAVSALCLFGSALFRIGGRYWPLPFILCIFAFTGLDPVGMFSNLSYYTYPQLFLTLHLALLFLAMTSANRWSRRLLALLAGVCLWAISFAALHFGTVLASPFLMAIAARRFQRLSFGPRDLLLVLIGPVCGWLLLLSFYRTPYLASVINAVRAQTQIAGYDPQKVFAVNWEALKHIAVMAGFVPLFLYGTHKLRPALQVPFWGALAILALVVIETSLFGTIRPYYQGWFSRPMWLTAFLMVTVALAAAAVSIKRFRGRSCSAVEEAALLALVPCVLFFISSCLLSGLGILTLLHCAVPLTACACLVVLQHLFGGKTPLLFKLTFVILFLAPFYYSVCWADWKFTYFDVFPHQAEATIEAGFGRGIKTNRIYRDLYHWVRQTAQAHCAEKDFILSYVTSPMVHMIARRRPALEDSFVCFNTRSQAYYRSAVAKMQRLGRRPKLAFVFEAVPAFAPLSLKSQRFNWFARQFVFDGSDPLSAYVLAHMRPAAEFYLHEGCTVRCFVDDAVE